MTYEDFDQLRGHLDSIREDANEAKEVVDTLEDTSLRPVWSLLDDIYGAADTALRKLPELAVERPAPSWDELMHQPTNVDPLPSARIAQHYRFLRAAGMDEFDALKLTESYQASELAALRRAT